MRIAGPNGGGICWRANPSRDNPATAHRDDGQGAGSTAPPPTFCQAHRIERPSHAFLNARPKGGTMTREGSDCRSLRENGDPPIPAEPRQDGAMGADSAVGLSGSG